MGRCVLTSSEVCVDDCLAGRTGRSRLWIWVGTTAESGPLLTLLLFKQQVKKLR
jgi:hypothetical protein